jgi:hypothetical protein
MLSTGERNTAAVPAGAKTNELVEVDNLEGQASV